MSRVVTRVRNYFVITQKNRFMPVIATKNCMLIKMLNKIVKIRKMPVPVYVAIVLTLSIKHTPHP